MKKRYYFGILIILILLGVFFFTYSNKLKVTNFDECVKRFGVVAGSQLRQCKTDSGEIYVESVSSEIGQPAQSEKNTAIEVESLASGSSIDSPLIVKGKAKGRWFFEASFPIELVDSNNNVIATGVAMATADSLTEDFVPFEAKIEFFSSEQKNGFLILKNDNPSGLPENSEQIKIPVVIKASANLTTVKVYFANDKLDPDVTCEKVFSVERQVAKTDAIAKAALEELLKGVTEKEKANGYRTTINTGVKINKLTIVNGIAKVDFNETMGEAVGGSCRVNFIRKQIEQTLKQFSTVKSVVISINGDSEYILQP